jgi:Fe-S cluster assembly ATPase SufC
MSDHQVAFRCDDVHVSIGEKEVVKGVTLTIKAGEIHALMGPKGPGRQFANALGSPTYTLTKGKIYVNGEDVTEAEADEKSRKGTLAFSIRCCPASLSPIFWRAKARHGDP